MGEEQFNEEDLEALRAAARETHEKLAMRGQILRAFCVCGHPSGPGTRACEAYGRLLRAVTAPAEGEADGG